MLIILALFVSPFVILALRTVYEQISLSIQKKHQSLQVYNKLKTIGTVVQDPNGEEYVEIRQEDLEAAYSKSEKNENKSGATHE